MKVVWQSLLVFNVLLKSLIVCRSSNQENIVASISYHKEFNFDKILVQFDENEKVILDVSKIKYFFIFPNNFYCENVKVNDKPLPLFFIKSTKKDFLTLILSLLKISEDDIEKLLDNTSSLYENKDDILDLRKNLRKYFPNANSIQDIEKLLTLTASSLENKNSIHNLKETDQSSFSKVYSNQDPTEKGIQDIDVPRLTRQHLFEWKFQKRYIIPVIRTKNIFISKQKESSSENSNCIIYSTFHENFLNDTECVGSGNYGSCFKVAIQLSNDSFDKNFVFKKIDWKSYSYLDEITIFSHISVDEQYGFCRPQSIIMKDDGNCVGFLIKYAEFGNLADFAAKHTIKDYKYFYNQLLDVSKAINVLHQKGINHGDLHMKNIFVCKKENAPGGNNYFFQLGDFGSSYISHLKHNNDHNIGVKRKQAEKKSNCRDCIKLYRTDLSSFVQLLPEILISFYLCDLTQHLADKTMFILTVTLERAHNSDANDNYFKEIEKYFNCIDDSFNDVNTTKFGDIDKYSNSEFYQFTDILDVFVAIYHTPENYMYYSKGETLVFHDCLKYTLYSYVDGSFTIDSPSGKEDIVSYINSYYTERSKVNDVLVKIK